MTSATLEVLLTVYNGAQYLDASLESLCMQDYQDWSLLVLDGGSTDGTQDILDRWHDRLGGRMTLLPNPDNEHLSVEESYSRLVAASTAPYITIIADDDIYHPSRFSLTLDAMRHHEANVGAERPVLVFTDAVVVNQSLAVIARSYWAYVSWRPPKLRPLGALLIQSAIPGGTTVLNRPLIELLGDPPFYEDFWTGWVAAAFGDLVPISTQTMDFRRDGSNYTELLSFGSTLRQLLTAPWTARIILHTRLDRFRPYARRFLERYRSRLSPEQIATVETYLNLSEMGPLARRWALLRYGVHYSSWLRKIGMLLLI